MLEQLLAFTETAKRGSFAAAARELGATPSAMAKAVGRLEAALGMRLFQRTTRRVSMTSDGERLFSRCRQVIFELEEIQAEALGTLENPQGTLRVDLPVVFGSQFILPMLVELASKHAGLKLDIRLSDAFVDIVNEGVDLAVRIGSLPDSGLIARCFGSQDWILCASPAYLRKHGNPSSLQSLSNHEAILFRMPTSGRDQTWQLQEGSQPQSLSPKTRFRCSDGEAMARVAEMGYGIAQLPDYIICDRLAAGTLVEVLPECRPRTTPIHAVMPANRMIPARVRVFLDALERLPLAHADARRQSRMAA